MKKIFFNFLFLISFSIQSKIPYKVCICTIGKDVEYALDNSIKTIEGIGQLFDDYRVFVYENNSTDNTATLLKQWAHRNTKITVTSENHSLKQLKDISIGRTWNEVPFRTPILAMARNIVMQQAMNHKYNSYEYIIMMDLDFEMPWNYQAITDIFELNQEWDAICANGTYEKGYMYDHFAYRPFDKPFGPELIGDEWWKNIPKIELPSKTLIPVISAYGGFTIYKRSSIEGCSYSGIVDDELESFYVNFIQKNLTHPEVKKYLSQCKKLPTIHILNIANPAQKYNYKIGIKLKSDSRSLLWRIHSGCLNYPACCDPNTFLAAMANRGHDKIFIYSEIKPIYGRGQ